ncbi:MAG: thioredoxin family protein [Euryarchaeota archaeon]|nr:thioredoxin family protein [Euryarchaeota archaeon]MBT7938188.1 thioredoxin family protein [Euryarchaeota archaeon]
MSNAMEMNWNNIESTLGGNETVFIDCWNPEEPNLKEWQPAFDKAAVANKDVIFARINTIEEPGLAEALGIAKTPTLMIVKKRMDILQKTGPLEEETLLDLIQLVRDLDVDELALHPCPNDE